MASRRCTRCAGGDPDAVGVTDFDTKVAVVVRDDLAAWQRLNVTAFLMSGVTAAAGPGIVGEDTSTPTAPATSRCCASRCSCSRRPDRSCAPSTSARCAATYPLPSTPPSCSRPATTTTTGPRSEPYPPPSSTSSASPCARRTATPTPCCAACAATRSGLPGVDEPVRGRIGHRRRRKRRRDQAAGVGGIDHVVELEQLRGVERLRVLLGCRRHLAHALLARLLVVDLLELPPQG